MIFHWHDPSGRTMAQGLTQPLTEMSTKNISWGWRRPVRSADNLNTFMCRLSWNLGSLNLLEPLQPGQACTGNALPLQVWIIFCYNSLFQGTMNSSHLPWEAQTQFIAGDMRPMNIQCHWIQLAILFDFTAQIVTDGVCMGSHASWSELRTKATRFIP